MVCSNSTFHCDKGYICDQASHLCVQGTACSDDGPCGGYNCNTTQGVCETACSNNFDCAQGYLCNPLTTKCIQGVPCTNDAPCNGYDCSNQGYCRIFCTNNFHCAQGYHCAQYQCVAN